MHEVNLTRCVARTIPRASQLPQRAAVMRKVERETVKKLYLHIENELTKGLGVVKKTIRREQERHHTPYPMLSHVPQRYQTVAQ